MIIKKELSVSNKRKTAIEAELRQLKFRPFPKANKKSVAVAGETEPVLDEEDEAAAGDFDYLLGMAIWSLTAEKVCSLGDRD
jgi:DNA topoisomerase-2